MAEQFANRAQSTLAVGADASQLTITVANGAVFPAGGTFRVLVDTELMLCTARTGGVLTVTRGAESSVAAAHGINAQVTAVLTAGVMVKVPLTDQANTFSALQTFGVGLVGGDGADIKHGQFGSFSSTVARVDFKVSGANNVVLFPDRMQVIPGLITFGGEDTNLYRAAANSLVTDDMFTAKSGGADQGVGLTVFGLANNSIGLRSQPTLLFKYESGISAGAIGTPGQGYTGLNLTGPNTSSTAMLINDASIELNRPIRHLSNSIDFLPRGDVGRGIMVTSGGNIPTLDIFESAAQTADVLRVINSAGTVIGFTVKAGGGIWTKGVASSFGPASPTPGTNAVFEFADDTSSPFLITSRASSASNPEWNARRARDATADLQSGDLIFRFNFQGRNQTSWGFPQATAAQIYAAVDAAPGATYLPGRLSFLTSGTSGSAGPIERMRIDSAGKLWLDPGVAGPDTNLYRSAANVLTTDDQLRVNVGSSGAPQDIATFSQAGGATGAHFVNSGNDTHLKIRWTGDGSNRLTLGLNGSSEGMLAFAGASGINDTNLYRSAADLLKTDDNFLALGYFASYKASENDGAFHAAVTGDADVRFTLFSNGKLSWGNGTVSQDTNLYRGGANTLTTDDSLQVAVAAYVGDYMEVGGSLATLPVQGQLGVRSRDDTRPTLNLFGSFGDAADLARFYTYAGTLRGKITKNVETFLTQPNVTDLIVKSTPAGAGTERFKMDALGTMSWGDGATPLDTNLYRISANALKTDDEFLATGFITSAAGFLGTNVQNTSGTGPYLDVGASNMGVVNRTNAAQTVLYVRGMAAQTGRIQEWQDSAAAPYAALYARTSSDAHNATGIIADFVGPVIRLGDGLGAGQSFTNGMGFKFHDAGSNHATFKYSAGTNTMSFGASGGNGDSLAFDVNGERLRINLGVIADGDVAVVVARNVGGTLSLQQVSMGAADSGGAGFKALRVPN